MNARHPNTRAVVKDLFTGMNRTEKKYADLLAKRQAAGEVVWWKFGVLKLRLATATFYDTDFVVQLANGEVEIHETKGFMRDDANVKLKVAASQYPFKFLLCKIVKDEWEIEEVKA